MTYCHVQKQVKFFYFCLTEFSSHMAANYIRLINAYEFIIEPYFKNMYFKYSLLL